MKQWMPPPLLEMNNASSSSPCTYKPHKGFKVPCCTGCAACFAVLSFTFGWLWGSIIIGSRGGQNNTIIGERVSQFALTTQGILTKFVRGVTFKGSNMDERCDWRWTPTTNQDVNVPSRLHAAD
jgi:hypothetical protein